MIKRFSSSYINTTDNFVIIREQHEPTDHEYRDESLYRVLCVVKNIIQRGDPTIGFPTKVSRYLSDEIGQVEDTPVHFVSNELCHWERTIKGDPTTSDYPAITFYNKYLPYALGKEYSFVKNLILPEADFTEIVGKQTEFSGQSVDFYLPQAHLVIEIDGYSHSEEAQARKDYERDKELQRNKLTVIRIKAKDIKEQNSNLAYEIRRINRIITSSREINEYKRVLTEKPSNCAIKHETIMRIQQLLLLELMEHRLDLTDKAWQFCIEKSDVDEIKQLIDVAYQDLQFWIKAVAGLTRTDVHFPGIIFTLLADQADLVIDYSIYKRYDDTCEPQGNKVYIRTDYYSGQDHFELAVAKPFKYDIDLIENNEDRLNMMFLLQNIFGFDEFRNGQEQIITNVLNGNDTVGILPTGAGKSVCYQFAAFLQPGVTVVVVPIISLMEDQKRSLNKKYHICHNNFISSAQEGKEKGGVLEAFQQGKMQIIWISPERFQSELFRNSLSVINENLHFSLAVIDEVHCLSEWGHDFRISYLTLIKTLRAYCPNAIMLGLTATASEFVLQDIRAEFGLGEPLKPNNVIAAYSMDRKELEFVRLEVGGDAARSEVVKDIVRGENCGNPDGQGLLFCKTINPSKYSHSSCKDMLMAMNQKDEKGDPVISGARLFYGEMDTKVKSKNQDDFMEGKFPLMICTKAFGMGIDNQNIRYTIHNSLPSSIESFYQEAGRAGRDGNNARCYIVYHVDDNSRKVVQQCADSGNLLQLLEKQRLLQQSDLGTTVFFLNSNHEDDETEFNLIFSIYQKILKSPVLPFGGKGDDSKQKIEQALYKLSILGIVKDWTVNYYNLFKGECVAYMADSNKITYESVYSSFLKYVRKYDSEFSPDDYEIYTEFTEKEDKQISDVIRLLIKWTNNNIVYNRVQCSKTMMDWCSKDVDDETFRENLEGYFRSSEEIAALKQIADNPKNWKDWFKIFFRFDHGKRNDFEIIDKDTVKLNHASLQRFLESYQNNTGLNYLDGMFQIMYKDQVGDNDLIRMKRSMEAIKKMSEDDQIGIIKSTLELAATLENQNAAITLSKLIIDYFPDKARMVFDYLHDNYSLMIELEKAIKRMEAIKWII